MWIKLLAVNGIAGAILWSLYREGILYTAWSNDILYIIPTIGIIFLFGISQMFRNIEVSHWCAETCVSLGLLGTALGIWSAFSGIDPSMVGDVNSIGAVIGVLLSGLGAALWTTMFGVFVNIILTANLKVVEDYEG